MLIEAVLLTGGRSSRMGQDKAALLWQGVPLAEVLAQRLLSVVERVTVLGQSPVPACAFVRDAQAYLGPLTALSSFSPEAEFVFVLACDIPAFEQSLVTVLLERLQRHPSVHALVPDVDHHLQPLCALYRAEAFTMIATVTAEDRKSMMSWIEALWVETFSEEELIKCCLSAHCVRSVDTPEMMEETLRQLGTRTV